MTCKHNKDSGRKCILIFFFNHLRQVFDEHGNDVTPKPLVELRTTALHEQLLQDHTDRFTPESERPSVYRYMFTFN